MSYLREIHLRPSGGLAAARAQILTAPMNCAPGSPTTVHPSRPGQGDCGPATLPGNAADYRCASRRASSVGAEFLGAPDRGGWMTWSPTAVEAKTDSAAALSQHWLAVQAARS